MRFVVVLTVSCLLLPGWCLGQDDADKPPEARLLERYKKMIFRDPYQKGAFVRMLQLYDSGPGLVEFLKDIACSGPN